MKITYLVYKKQDDGNTCLTIVSHEEWGAVVDANAGLPKEQQRYFIRDYIFDGDTEDCIVMEVSRAYYLNWINQHMKDKRKREHKANLRILSLDAPIVAGNPIISLGHIIPSGQQMEDDICSRDIMETLKMALSIWRPWAKDLLEYYLNGEQRTCTHKIAITYGVSLQTARKYKRQFEEFIKNFFDGFRFSPHIVNLKVVG